VLTDFPAARGLVNTVVLTAGAVIFSMILGLLLALLLDRKFSAAGSSGPCSSRRSW
jgi:sorbitol/mannitol transport system permease protein